MRGCLWVGSVPTAADNQIYMLWTIPFESKASILSPTIFSRLEVFEGFRVVGVSLVIRGYQEKK
jgi:hypothetical protein